MPKHPVIHFEIVGSDPDGLSKFFSDAFGWTCDTQTYSSSSNDAAQKYVVAMPTGEAEPEGYGINGGFGQAPEGYDGHVTFYIRVDDVEAALAKVESLGGSRLMGPEKISDAMTIGLFKDPQGHVIGLVDPEMPAS